MVSNAIQIFDKQTDLLFKVKMIRAKKLKLAQISQNVKQKNNILFEYKMLLIKQFHQFFFLFKLVKKIIDLKRP